MPLCPPGRIGTLRELHGAAVDSLKAASKIVASSLGKPESYVQVELKTDVPMVFGGTDEPTAACTLSSIGAIGGDKNKDISAAICAHLEEYYGIQPGRCARAPSRPRGSAPSSKLPEFGPNSQPPLLSDSELQKERGKILLRPDLRWNGSRKRYGLAELV